MSYLVSIQHGRVQDRNIVVVGQFSSSYKVQLKYFYKLLHPVFSESNTHTITAPLPGRLMKEKSPDYQGVPPTAGAPCQPWPQCFIPRLRKMAEKGLDYQDTTESPELQLVEWYEREIDEAIRTHSPPCSPMPQCIIELRNALLDFVNNHTPPCQPMPMCKMSMYITIT